MKSSRILIIFTVFFLLFVVSYSFAGTQYYSPDKDTYVYSVSADSNYSAETQMLVTGEDVCSSPEKRMYINFPNVNFSVNLTSLSLYLYETTALDKCGSDSDATLYCFNVTTVWNENITWNTQPSLSGLQIGGVNIGQSGSEGQEIISVFNIDLMPSTQADLSMMCRIGYPSSPDGQKYSMGLGTKENANTNYRPVLVMTFNETEEEENQTGTGGANITQALADTTNVLINQVIDVGAIVSYFQDESTVYFGLSIGDQDTGIWCNRDCYADCTLDSYGTSACDYYNTSMHNGQSIDFFRDFKFMPNWFEANQSYDLAIGIYNDTYLSPSQALAYRVFSDYFTITEPTVTISDAYIMPNNPLPNTNIEISWSSNLNSDTFIRITKDSESIVSRGKFYTTTGENTKYHNISIGSAFFSNIGNYDYFIESCCYPQTCGAYICGNTTGSFTVGGETETKPVSDLVGDMFSPLGTTGLQGLYLFALILSLVFSVAVVYLTKHTEFGIMVFVMFLIMFSFIGWLPFWIIILFVVIAGLFVATKLKGVMSGS